MDTITVNVFGEERTFDVVTNTYNANNALYVGLQDEEGPYCTLTVCLPDYPAPPEGYSYFDSNNDYAKLYPQLVEQGIIEETDVMGHSGFCLYPLVKFNL